MATLPAVPEGIDPRPEPRPERTFCGYPWCDGDHTSSTESCCSLCGDGVVHFDHAPEPPC